MKPILEFCANNASLGTGEAIRQVKEHVDCDVYEYGCLTACGICYLFPYRDTSIGPLRLGVLSSLFYPI